VSRLLLTAREIKLHLVAARIVARYFQRATRKRSVISRSFADGKTRSRVPKFPARLIQP